MAGRRARGAARCRYSSGSLLSPLLYTRRLVEFPVSNLRFQSRTTPPGAAFLHLFLLETGRGSHPGNPCQAGPIAAGRFQSRKWSAPEATDPRSVSWNPILFAQAGMKNAGIFSNWMVMRLSTANHPSAPFPMRVQREASPEPRPAGLQAVRLGAWTTGCQYPRAAVAFDSRKRFDSNRIHWPVRVMVPARSMEKRQPGLPAPVEGVHDDLDRLGQDLSPFPGAFARVIRLSTMPADGHSLAKRAPGSFHPGNIPLPTSPCCPARPPAIHMKCG